MHKPPTELRQRGDAAELAACEFLQTCGLQPLTRNAGFRVGELDLVMQDGDTLVFVEVRYRKPGHFGDGFASIDRGKRRRIAHAAQLWLARQPRMATRACRFDVVAVTPAGDRYACDWLRHAFTLDDC